MTTPATASRLEQRYRRLLRLLPAGYRAKWQDDMVASFLETVHTDDPEQAEYLADYGRPSWSETLSVLRLAIRLRIPGSAGRAVAGPRDVLWAAALRTVGLVGLLSGAVSATALIGVLLWQAGRLPALPPAPQTVYLLPTGWLRPVVAVVNFGWLPAYLTVLARQWAVSRRLTAFLVVLVVLLDLPSFAHLGLTAALNVLTVACLLLPLIGLAAVQDDAPPVPWRPWLAALLAGSAVQTTLLVVGLHAASRTLPVLDPPAVYCVAFIGTAAVHLLRRSPGREARSLALALLAVPVLGLRLVSLAGYGSAGSAPGRSALMASGLVEAGVVLAVAVVLATVARRALRRPPAAAAGR